VTQNVRFPRPAATLAGPSEASQIITLLDAVGSLPQGGAVTFADVTAWRTAAPAAPYTHVVLEFTATSASTFGTGAVGQGIGLFGELTATGKRYLLGVLGYGLGAVLPQIQIISATVGFAQIVEYVPVYDKLSVGGISGAIGPDTTLTVTARPISQRYYGG
jgi:hypothetical protein